MHRRLPRDEEIQDPPRTVQMDGRAGRLGEGAGEGGMVAVGVGHQHMADRLAFDRAEQGRQMGLVQRAGVDHRHLTVA